MIKLIMNLKSYLISEYDITNKQDVKNIFNNIKQIDYICLRMNQDKLSAKQIQELESYFVQLASKYKRAKKIGYVFLKDINSAKKYKCDGVHLKSSQANKIKQAKRAGLKCIISCHTNQDIKKAILNKCDYITYSPVYKSKGSDGCGTRRLQLLVCRYHKIKFFALGGIVSNKELSSLQKVKNLYGFASIRYFYS